MTLARRLRPRIRLIVIFAVGALAFAVLVGAAMVLLRASPQDVPVVIVAAGDIACDPAYPDFNAGEGTAKGCHEKATGKLVEMIKPAAVLALGDIQYVKGDPTNYAASYDPTWGRFKNITRPAIGNHEGGEGGSNKSYFTYFGSNAGDARKAYYSYDLGKWHMIALNSNCGVYSFNGSHTGCEAGSPQDEWLKADLAAHSAACTLAYFHVPRFASGRDHHSDASTDQTMTALWQDLYDGGADVVLNGHQHNYERFAPLTPGGTVDPAKGIREFVVGTGGDDHEKFASPVAGSEVRISDSFGVLQLTLHATSYEWRFVNDGSAGATNNDSGTAECHG